MYIDVQHALTLAIEGVALVALVFFPLAMAAELVAGFRAHRAQCAAPAAEAAPAAAPAPAADVSVAVETLAAPVLRLVESREKIETGLASLKAIQLDDLSVAELRNIASRLKVSGRSSLRTKDALVGALVKYPARELFKDAIAA